MAQQATEHRFHLPIADEDSLREFIRVAWGVEIPDVQVCPNHSTPWRAFADAYFARHRVAVWKASRGFGGKSFLLALLGLTEAVTLKADVNILGGSGEQSENVHKYAKKFWDYEGAPANLLVSDPSKRETHLAWGNTIKALLASSRSTRGPHPQRLRLDEADEMELSILDAAMGQTMGKDGVPAQTVISSTHQHADGTMTEVLQRAAEKGWKVHEWCYKETEKGWLDAAEIEGKRQDVTAAMWNVEYDLQEPSPESRAIQPASVEAMFRADLGKYTGGNGEYIEAEPPLMKCLECDALFEVDEECPECESGNVELLPYTTGADWAKKKDWTVVATLNASSNPIRTVAFERCGRLPWPVMTGKLDRRLERYGGSGVHDGTGLGDVVNDQLRSAATSFVMVGRARSDLLSNYIAAIERGEIVAPMIDFMYNEHKHASVDDVYGSGHLPDSIAAMALAWHGLDAGQVFSFGYA